MSEENVEIVRRAYEAFVAGGAEAAEPFLHPELLWEDRPDLPDANVYRGHAGFRTAVGRFYEAFEVLSVSAEQLIHAGKWVVVSHRWQGRGKEGSVPFETVDWSVFTVENGMITRRQAFTERTDAFEVAGLSE
jgi:ketosteroid isomerase-like protein